MIYKLLLLLPAGESCIYDQAQQEKCPFSGLKVKGMSRFTMTQENSPSVINLTVLNLHKERIDKFALSTWQINLLFATLIGKEIIQESIIPYPHFRRGGHHPLLFKNCSAGPG